MSSQAFHRRTFGIKNEKCLVYSGAVSIIILVVQVLSLLIEGFLMRRLILSSTSNDFVNSITTLHFGGFLGTLFIFIFSLTESDMKWKSQKLAFRKMASFTTFTVIYLYNPWIVEYQVEAVEFYGILKCTTFVFTCSSLIFSVVCSFATFILWRMSRIEADYEPCEVIYGAEDSETKKLMEYYE